MEAGQNTVRAIVRAIEGNEAIVEVEHGGCGRCHEEGGCGGQQLTQVFCGGPKTWRVPNTVDARPDDRVTIAIGEGSVRRSANLAYVFPLTAAIVAAVAGTALAGDAGGIAGAALGLGGAFVVIRRRASGAVENPDARPHIVSHS